MRNEASAFECTLWCLPDLISKQFPKFIAPAFAIIMAGKIVSKVQEYITVWVKMLIHIVRPS